VSGFVHPECMGHGRREISLHYFDHLQTIMNYTKYIVAILSLSNVHADSIRGTLNRHSTIRRLEEKTISGECTIDNFVAVVGTKETLISLLGLPDGSNDETLANALKTKCDEALTATK